MNELAKRGLFGGIYVAIVAGVLLFFPPMIPALFAIFSVMCLLEVNALSGFHKPSPALWLVWLGVWVSVIIHAIAPYALILAGSSSLYFLFKSKAHRRLWFRSLYVIQPFVLSVAALYFEFIEPAFLLFVFMTIWFNDTGAYLSGKNFGKTLLAPRISPKKTLEGFIGGTVLAVLVMFIPFPIFVDYSLLFKGSVAFLVALSATLGDLIQSRMKRKAGVKDSGKIMPGHGGAFDRLDSFIFALPIALFFAVAYTFF
jgi:phosphatidate cytidylyltransferase